MLLLEQLFEYEKETHDCVTRICNCRCREQEVVLHRQNIYSTEPLDKGINSQLALVLTADTAKMKFHSPQGPPSLPDIRMTKSQLAGTIGTWRPGSDPGQEHLTPCPWQMACLAPAEIQNLRKQPCSLLDISRGQKNSLNFVSKFLSSDLYLLASFVTHIKDLKNLFL